GKENELDALPPEWPRPSSSATALVMVRERVPKQSDKPHVLRDVSSGHEQNIAVLNPSLYVDGKPTPLSEVQYARGLDWLDIDIYYFTSEAGLDAAKFLEGPASTDFYIDVEWNPLDPRRHPLVLSVQKDPKTVAVVSLLDRAELKQAIAKMLMSDQK